MLAGAAALLTGAVPVIVVNRCAPGCQIPQAVGISGICVGLFLMLGGFITSVAGILRVDRRAYGLIACCILGVAAAGLLVFALGFNALF